MEITVIVPGLLTTVQDEGRFGHQASGFSVSGCMDARAMHDANVLVNNYPGEAVLEMQYLGGSFRFEGETYFALTGAEMHARLNGAPVKRYRAVKVRRGDVLECGRAVSGRFAYLAVAGGLNIRPVLGSLSTNLKCRIGGFQGRKLKAGDVLPLKWETDWLRNGYLKDIEAPDYPQIIVLRTTTGPQEQMFTAKGLADFYGTEYAVSEQSDRMGFRLSGAAVESARGVDIISDGIVEGSVQVPSNGMPMILLADRQTTGGYAKIATVIAADIPKLVQCMPGAKVRFTKVSVKEAVRLYKRERRARARFRRKTGWNPGNMSLSERIFARLFEREMARERIG